MKFLCGFAVCVLVCVACQRTSNVGGEYVSVTDLPSRNIFLVPADSVRSFTAPGSFVVIGDTVLLSDYYYNYNDGKELTVFRLNKRGEDRIIAHREGCPTEVRLSGYHVNIVRRGGQALFEQYSTSSLSTASNLPECSVSFLSMDQITKTDYGFLGTEISEGKRILNVYDSNGEWARDIDPFDGELDSVKTADRRYAVGQGCLSYNRNKRYAVYATAYTGDIFIYKANAGKIVQAYHARTGNGLPDNFMDFKVRNSTMLYAVDICSDGDYVYILYKGDRVTAAQKRSYILRIDENGNMFRYCCYGRLSTICVTGGTLYGIAPCERGDYSLLKSVLR